jgi:RimJ/RimL family protein N-acetyltransferase
VIGDYSALRNLVIKFNNSEYAAYDNPWPSSKLEILRIVMAFSKDDRFLAVTLKEDGAFIGLISLTTEEQSSCDFNLGYNFSFDYHGRGFATEACREVVRYAFDHLNTKCIESGTAAWNQKSWRLLARLGFEKIGEKMVSFHKDDEGKPIEFLGYEFILKKEDFQY